MARVTLTAVNSLTAPAAFGQDPTHGARKAIKRMQFQWSRPAGITASSFTLLGRLADDLPWTQVQAANTTATGLIEVPPYPQFAVALTSLTGAGSFVFELREPT